jgi:hypothetical protein
MKKIILLACAGLLVAAFAARSNPPVQPGMMLYTPTRLEWLAVDLEASYHQDFSRDSNYSLHYLPKAPNTVLIYVHYTSETAATTLDSAIDAAKGQVSQDASSHGWSSWVKIEVQRKLIKK